MTNLAIILNSFILFVLIVSVIYIIRTQLKLTALAQNTAEQNKEQQIKNEERHNYQDQTRNYLIQLLNQQKQEASEQRSQFDKHQLETFKLLQDSLQKGMQDISQQINTVLHKNTETLDKKVTQLTQETNQRLQEISGHVDKRLSEGFEKTTATFTDVVKRLAIIDEAQKKIADLSSNVISLQEILVDKRSRGAFGEVQLSALISNVLPETTYQLQYTLSNHMRCDCILFLPEPTGNIVIDAKFPLETYQKLISVELSESERNKATTQFARDIKKHIDNIADKYIILNETSDGAMMFIPAEAIFAEIHAHYAEIVAYAQRRKVWMVSPTTMMAVLTTVRAVLKDADTRKQAHIIQEHLSGLSKDFNRFQDRMEKLALHIKQANQDVEEVAVSSRKIMSKFNKIEQVELKEEKLPLITETSQQKLSDDLFLREFCVGDL